MLSNSNAKLADYLPFLGSRNGAIEQFSEIDISSIVQFIGALKTSEKNNILWYNTLMSKTNILVIEDSDDIARGIKMYLEKRNLIVHIATTAAEAKQKIADDFAVCVLDINLPDGNGKNLFAYIKSKKDMPIIFLTVKNDERDIIEGLDRGADDYITKPFSLAVLYSRINAVLRRTKQLSKTLIKLQQYTLDTGQKRFFKDQTEIKLTAQEFDLLRLFMEHPNWTFTREKLLALLWDSHENFVADNTLTATVKRLRQKLDEPILKTIHGVGYRLEI